MGEAVIEQATLERMLTARQVGDFLHVSISAVRRWSDKGMLKSYRVGPRGDRRFRRVDVLRFLEESGSQCKTSIAEEKALVSHSAGKLSVLSEEVILAEKNKSTTK